MHVLKSIRLKRLNSKAFSKHIIAPFIVCVAIVALGVSVIFAPAVAYGDTTTAPLMLIKANDLAEIQAAGGTVAPQWVAYGTGGPNSSLGTPVQTVTSYTSLVNQYNDYVLQGHFKWVLLDMEPWEWTPKNEYANLAHYEELSANLVHAHGMKIIIAGTISSKMLANGAAGNAAKYADAYGIQAQPLDGNTVVYKKFVDTAAAQARAANPNVMIGAGIATDSIGVPITGAQMYNAYESVRPVISWYWLNAAKWSKGSGCAPTGCPNAAISFLKLLDKKPT